MWGPQPNPDTSPSSQTSAWGRMEIHNICLILPSNHFHTLQFRYDVYLRADHMPVSLTGYKWARLLNLKSLKWFCRGTRLPIRNEITSRHQIKSNTHLASVPAVRCCHGTAFCTLSCASRCLGYQYDNIWACPQMSPLLFYKQTHLRIICVSEEHRSLERPVNCAQMKAWYFPLAILQFKSNLGNISKPVKQS